MNASSDEIKVKNNEAEHRFEVVAEGHRAVSEYIMAGKQIVLAHTEVPKALEGRGIGSALTRAVLEHARAEGLTVIPICPFARAFLQRHSEYRDLLGGR